MTGSQGPAAIAATAGSGQGAQGENMSSDHQDDTVGGAMQRRDFLRLSSMLGLSAATASAFAAMGVPAAFAQEAEPVKGGILNFALPSDPANWDIIATSTSRVYYSAGPVYNNLVKFDPMEPTAIVADLAESWEISEDGLTYTFKLRDGVKWHDGQPFSSADVKKTFDTVKNPPEGQASPRQFVFNAVETIEAPDALTVVLNLSKPSPALLANLANGAMMIGAAHIIEAKGNLEADLIGTGPFKLKEYIRGVSIELEKNPDYFIPDRPYLDGIKIFIVPDSSTVFNYFRTGQLHLNEGMSGASARDAEAQFGDKVEILRQVGSGFDAVAMNAQRAPFDNPLVREAISLAFDRQNGLDVLWQGGGEVSGAFPPSQWALPKDELAAVSGFGPDHAANVARAKELLAEAGFPDGFATNMIARNNTGTVALVTWVQSQLSAIGVNVTLDIQEDAVALPRFASRDYDMLGAMLAVQGIDPDPVFGETYASHGRAAYANMEIEGLDEKIAVIATTIDPEERIRLSNEAQLIALKAYGVLPFYFKVRNYGIQKNVHNFILHPIVDNNIRMQDVWLS